MARELPSGTVTFLFTDVEGSTRLLDALGADAYADALATHRRLLRDAFTRHGGVEVDTQGDAFFVAFPTAPGALAAALEATTALGSGPIKVRIGLHTGTPLPTDEGYVGPDVHKGARIAAAGHGGQILLSAATAALLDASLRDLGQHRLKDLTAPERIFQADDGDHPPLKTLHQTNLPIPVTPFLGREAEVAKIRDLLLDPTKRLVTLTGPGGTGKTRLALQAAASVAEGFPDGVWWVPLAPLRDPQLVLPTAAQALGAGSELAQHIGSQRLLLVLDNFEHLVAAADGLALLLRACPSLTVLVTSREPLHLASEHEYAVDPLEPAEAAELFITRASATRRDFAASGEVAQICARVDYLPLAIELAAARVNVLSPAALLARLEQRLPLLAGGARDLPERQRTLRATIEWSHELLSDDEQRLFRRLAVFRGGCTLDATESVADAELATLQSLVDKSLLRMRDDRFWMLETIREFAVERLEASGEADPFRDRHARYFTNGMVGEALSGSARDVTRSLRPPEQELPNLIAALDRLQGTGQWKQAARVTAALAPFWRSSGQSELGRRRLDGLLNGSPQLPAPLLADVHWAASVVNNGLGDHAAAVVHARAELAIARDMGDDHRVVRALTDLAVDLARWGTYPNVEGLYREAIAISGRIGDVDGAARAKHNLARFWGQHLGRDEDATSLLEEVREDARARQDQSLEAYATVNLAEVAIMHGRYLDAAPLIERGLDLAIAVGDQYLISGAKLGRGELHRALGERKEAAHWLAEALEMFSATGDRGGILACLEQVALLLAERGEGISAMRMFGAVDALRDVVGVGYRAPKTGNLERARDAGGVEHREEYERGRELPMDEAVVHARRALGTSEESPPSPTRLTIE